ncbi:hypothetical protein ST47_g5301 [Ascochyta rabiei]|uniref:Uncharacterized protein n=1 Tax=Didymella rabiei TaxID=5454 RepID=A0A163E563_DIDRA|nr:hypothetical protein ST47_g5301 [Ascochyta rabiei]
MIASRHSVATLISYLRVSHEASTTDPRDNIYAILSLLEPSVRQLSPVDYSLNVEQVVSDAIMACITISQNLAILSLVRSSGTCGDPALNFSMESFGLFLSAPLPAGMPPQLLNNQHGPFVSQTCVEDFACSEIVKDASSLRRSFVVGKLHTVAGVHFLILHLRARTHLVDILIESTDLSVRYCAEEFLDSTLNEEIDPATARVSTVLYETRNWAVSRLHRLTTLAWEKCEYKFEKLKNNWMSGGGLNASIEDILQVTQWETCIDIKSSMESGFASDKSRDNISQLPQVTPPTLQKTSWCSPINRIFYTSYRIGFTSVDCLPGDVVYVIDRVRYSLTLRETSPNKLGIIGICYFWAALELNYWNLGSHKGHCADRLVDMGAEQTSTISNF